MWKTKNRSSRTRKRTNIEEKEITGIHNDQHNDDIEMKPYITFYNDYARELPKD